MKKNLNSTEKMQKNKNIGILDSIPMLWTPIRILYQHPRCLVCQQKSIPMGVDQKCHPLHTGSQRGGEMDLRLHAPLHTTVTPCPHKDLFKKMGVVYT